MPEVTAATPAIIVVDDEPEILLILRRLVRDLADNHDIIVAQNGTEALAQLARRSVPLLITDYRMPGMNGLELAKAVRAASPTTVMLMITADLTSDIPAQAYAAGVTHFLTKPFPLAQLRLIVRSVLGAREAGA